MCCSVLSPLQWKAKGFAQRAICVLSKVPTKEHEDPKNACCNVHTISNPNFSVVIDNSIVHFGCNPPLFDVQHNYHPK